MPRLHAVRLESMKLELEWHNMEKAETPLDGEASMHRSHNERRAVQVQAAHRRSDLWPAQGLCLSDD